MAFSGSSSSSTPSSEINVTPLIDVLLVLLIIFMVIVPQAPLGLSSQVPQSRASEPRTAPVRVSVAGATGGDLRYEVEGRAIPRSQLTAELRGRLAMRAVRGVYITASPGVGYQIVAEVVSQANVAGAGSVALGRL